MGRLIYIFFATCPAFLLGLTTNAWFVFVIDVRQAVWAYSMLMLSVLCKGFDVPVRCVKKVKGHSPKEIHLNLLNMIIHIWLGGSRLAPFGAVEFYFHGLQECWIASNWLYVLRISAACQIDSYGDVARFDYIQTTIYICFLEDAFPLWNASYWRRNAH